MTDIPVFTSGFKIVGYLDSVEIPAEVLRDHDNFQKIAYHLTRAPDASEMSLTTTGGVAQAISFGWKCVPSRRLDSDFYADRGRHRAFVLEVAEAEVSLLAKVRGFKWFAELHGDIVRDVPAAVRGGTRVA